MPCTVCQHPKRRDIDQALITGSATLAALSQEYGLSTSALHRHKAHLQANVNQAKAQLQDHLRQGCIFWLSQALEMSMQTARTAQAEGNGKVVLQAIRQGTRLINIILKQDLQMDDRIVYEIMASPQWSTQAGLLPSDARILSGSRQALTGILSTPCPETAAQPLSSNPLEDLDLLQQAFSGLVSQPAPAPKHPQPRDKSGKVPGKTPFRKDNN